MTEEISDAMAAGREAATFAALIDTARRRQQAAHKKSPLMPRFLLDGAHSMAAHMNMSEQRMRDCLAPMALWQLYLQSAFGANIWDFAAVREHAPVSYERVRTALAAMESRPQVVSAVFHMAAFPLVCTLIGAAWREMHDGPLHMLVATRNMGWLRFDSNRWVTDAVEVLPTGPAGLRHLIAGLKTGSIKRLLILADGPHAPGTVGTRPLSGVSPALAIKTTLLAKIHALGIPLVPFTHEWDSGRLVLTPRPPLDPATLSETETIDAVIGHIEDLLRRRPEQWINWSAARILS
jgi:lauroyl/myristoyl acyltransferase